MHDWLIEDCAVTSLERRLTTLEQQGWEIFQILNVVEQVAMTQAIIASLKIVARRPRKPNK